MFSFRNTVSVSKIKSLSKTFGCSFSSLRYTLRSTSREKALLNISNKDLRCDIIPSPCINRFFSKEESIKEPSNEIDMESITSGNVDLLKKLKVLMLEVEVMRQEGQRVPSVLTNENWKELLGMPSRSQRVKHLLFWWLNERKRENKKKKKELQQSIRADRDSTLEDKKKTNHIYYGFGGSNIFLRIYDSTIDYYMNQKVIRAMMFGQKLVIDCSYDEYMTPKEAALCAKQLTYLFAENRLSDDPFDLYFCNANKSSKLIQRLSKYIPTLYDETFPLNITENSYMNLFPKEQLVYLTPHCRQNLKTYSHDDIYIIGAMVDKVNNDPLSLGKAKALGLRMAKLPLDLHLDWGIGTKSLTLNQVQAILLDMKKFGDWNKAFQHVPKRKLKKDEEDNNQKKNFHYLKKRNLVC